MSAVLLPAWIKPLTLTENHYPDWWKTGRKRYWNEFIRQGLPTSKEERFKYTDLSFLANANFKLSKAIQSLELENIIKTQTLADSILLVFVNGHFIKELSQLVRLPNQIIACSMKEAALKHPDLTKRYSLINKEPQFRSLVNLNAALSEDGLFFYLPASTKLTSPIHLLSIAMSEEAFAAHPQHLFVLGEKSQLTLIEEYVAGRETAYFMNIVISIAAEKKARLDYYKIQQEGRQAKHFAHTFIDQKAESEIKLTQLGIGAAFARDEVKVALQEAGADCRSAGFYRLNQDGQYIDYHLDIHHEAPHSQSEMFYKGVLDKQSRAVFNGRLYVKEGAQKILAYQANHNLLLSNKAEINTKPELEIYADDVKCKHGTSTGQINAEALFYLRSRGLSKNEALSLLLRGFAGEIMQRLSHPGLYAKAEALFAW